MSGLYRLCLVREQVDSELFLGLPQSAQRTRNRERSCKARYLLLNDDRREFKSPFITYKVSIRNYHDRMRRSTRHEEATRSPVCHLEETPITWYNLFKGIFRNLAGPCRLVTKVDKSVSPDTMESVVLACPQSESLRG
jgi:hypothetical protein